MSYQLSVRLMFSHDLGLGVTKSFCEKGSKNCSRTTLSMDELVAFKIVVPWSGFEKLFLMFESLAHSIIVRFFGPNFLPDLENI